MDCASSKLLLLPWRKLLKLRNYIYPLQKHIIIDGQSTFFWHDNWCSLSRSLGRFTWLHGVPFHASVVEVVMILLGVSRPIRDREWAILLQQV